MAISVIGRQFTMVAVPYQVFTITHSVLAVGMLGLVQFGPLLIASLYGGVLADTRDRRTLIMLSQFLMALTSVVLALGAIGLAAPLWLIYVVSACAALLTGIELPARLASVPRLVSRRDIPAAISLYQVVAQFSLVAGPAAAGFVIARSGLVAAYSVDAIGFFAGALLIARVRRMPPEEEVSPGRLRAPLEALAFVMRRPVVVSLMIADLDAMIFGLPRALFPVLAATTFHTGPSGLGLLYAAPAAGALLGSLFTGWIARARRPGLMVTGSVAAWGTLIALFGLVRSLPLALAILAFAGTADMMSSVFRHTILQLAVPDSWRGRVSALNGLTINGGPRLGDAESGAVAAISTPQISVVSGGLACVVGIALLAAFVPALTRYRLDV